MKYPRLPQSAVNIGVVALALLCGFPQCPAQKTITAGPGSALTIPQAQLVQPEALNQLLQSNGNDKPLLLQVGSHLLFDEAHISGSLYAGAGSQPTGLQQLDPTVSTISKKKAIVLYCGCCPWNHCPNIGPAFMHLHDMGFTNVKVLYLANNLGTDWVAKGYPVERSR